MSWLDYTNEHYDDHAEKWSYVDAHMKGVILDDGEIERFLIQRSQGESEGAYTERKRIAAYTPHFARAVVALAGMVFAIEDKAGRTWTEPNAPGLGNPEDEGSILHPIWKNADGTGTNLPTLVRKAALQLVGKEEVWCLVDGRQKVPEAERTGSQADNIGPASVRIIKPEAVPDFSDTEVKVKSQTDKRASLREEQNLIIEYSLYRLEEVSVYRETKEGEGRDATERAALVRSSSYGGEGFRYWRSNDRREPILPVFRVDGPIDTDLGYLMARDANNIFNMENARDFHLWASAFARYQPDVRTDDGGFNKDLWDKILEFIEKGYNVIPGPGDYVAPPMDGAQERRETIKEKMEKFFATFFQSYGDAARERTATEIRQDFRSGVEAYLTFLSGALDALENAIYWRLEQIYFPNRPGVWGTTRVKRSTDFAPTDDETRAKLITETLAALPIDLPPQSRVRIAMQLLDMVGVEYDRDELETYATAGARLQARREQLRALTNGEV